MKKYIPNWKSKMAEITNRSKLHTLTLNCKACMQTLQTLQRIRASLYRRTYQ